MRISMWTSYLIEWTPHDMVRTMAEHGWRTLELSDEHGHDLLDAGDPEATGRAFRRFAADHGVSFPQGHFYLATRGIRPHQRTGRQVADIAPADDVEFARAMDDMKRWVTLFQALGVEAGVLHIGGGLQKAGWSIERTFARRVQALAAIAEFAKGGPTRICLENLPGPYSGMRTPADYRELARAAGSSNAGICLDTSHAKIDGLDIPEFIRDAGADLHALHISDNLGSHDDHMLPYGRGVIDWGPVMCALREVSYTGLFNFETPGENRCPAPVRLAKLDYARQLARWMVDEAGRRHD